MYILPIIASMPSAFNNSYRYCSTASCEKLLPIAKIRSGDCLTVTDITLESRLVSPGDSTLMKAFPAFTPSTFTLVPLSSMIFSISGSEDVHIYSRFSASVLLKIGLIAISSPVSKLTTSSTIIQ